MQFFFSNKFPFDLIISISLGKVFCFVFFYILSEEEIWKLDSWWILFSAL